MLDRGSPNFEPSMPSRKMLRSAVLHHSTPLGAWADGTCRWPADSSPWTCCNRGWQSKLLRKHEGILCLVNRLGCKWIPLQKFHMNMFQNHMWTRVITCVNTCDYMCEHVWLHVWTRVITCDHVWFWNMFMWNFCKGKFSEYTHAVRLIEYHFVFGL